MTTYFQQTIQGALGTLYSCLNTGLHFRTIHANISILGSMEEIIKIIRLAFRQLSSFIHRSNAPAHLMMGKNVVS
jgi:hypothetical protein